MMISVPSSSAPPDTLIKRLSATAGATHSLIKRRLSIARLSCGRNTSMFGFASDAPTARVAMVLLLIERGRKEEEEGGENPTYAHAYDLQTTPGGAFTLSERARERK